MMHLEKERGEEKSIISKDGGKESMVSRDVYG